MSLTLKLPNQLIAKDTKWVINDLWLTNGVGILAAEPKCGKTWLAWEIAISLASGTKCLGTFDVPKACKVLVFNGEDSEQIQKDRIEALCKSKGLSLDQLTNLNIMQASSLRLDVPSDVADLRSIVDQVRPTLIILDCFVRLHRINENNSAAVAELLGHLRSIQKDYDTSIILVHHSSKGKSKSARGGQKMRA